MSGPGFVTRRTARDTHGARNRQGQRARLPRFPRRQPRWQRISLGAGKGIAGLALGIAALAVADTVTTSPNLHYLVAVVFIAIAAVMGWAAWVAKRNLSTNSQTHNLSIRGLSRRFRRG